MMMVSARSHAIESRAALERIAQQLSQELTNGDRLGLTGPLGAGKTTFVQALARALGIRRPVESPTFVVRQSFVVPYHPTIRTLVHVDLYRIENLQAVEELGLSDDWGNPETLVIVEWIEQAPLLAQTTTWDLRLSFGKTPTARLVTIDHHPERTTP